jgi:hypothetical protein
MSDLRLLARITAVEPLDGFRLRLTFTDGLVREVDLSGDLWGPMAEPLQGPAYFRQVSVDPELGTVVWPNGYDLDPDVLHGDHESVGRSVGRSRRHRGSAQHTSSQRGPHWTGAPRMRRVRARFGQRIGAAAH